MTPDLTIADLEEFCRLARARGGAVDSTPIRVWNPEREVWESMQRGELGCTVALLRAGAAEEGEP